MQRRTANRLLVVAGSSLAAGAVGFPSLIAAFAPGWKRSEEAWQSVGLLPQFPVGEVSQTATVQDSEAWPRPAAPRSVFVWRRSESDLVVFSRSCTDLGCPLEYERGSGCFLCPCHGGIFAQDGRRLAGPPRTPMVRYAHRVRENVLEIDIASVPPAA